MNPGTDLQNRSQRLWLALHARRAEQPWLLPAALTAALMFIALLASYVHLVNTQVLRGEQLRAAQRNAPLLAGAALVAGSPTSAKPAAPERIAITTAPTTVAYTAPAP